MKQAKLVSVNFMTRVIVDDNATYEEILEAAKSTLHIKVDNELSENLEFINDDKECPFNVTDAMAIGMKELKENISHHSTPSPEGVKSVLAQRLKEILDNMTQEEFDEEWNRITALGLEGPSFANVL